MNNFLRVRIDGLNANKIVNCLIDREVFIKNLKTKNKYIVFEIAINDENILKEVCKKYHKKYTVLYKNGIKNLILRLRNYFGFLIATILISSYIFSFNLYIFEVNLTYSSTMGFDLTNIEKLLKENNVCVGSKRTEINIHQIQNLILESQDNVAGCSVIKNGGKINIVIYPGAKKYEIDNNDIVSKYNAVISKVEIFAGKSKIKEGDIVKIDDTLIENINGAKGNILGKIYYSDYIIFNENQFEKVLTGNYFEFEDIYLFNKNVTNSQNLCKFSNYIEENCVFYVSKNLFLNVKRVKTKCLEFKNKEKFIPFESVENDLKQQLKENLLSKVEFKDKITNITFSTFRENNLVRLDCFVECEINLTK